MSGFLFALIACLVASIGARDQVLVHRLGAVQGRRPMLLAIALLATAATSALAAWAGARLLADLPAAHRSLAAALALLAAGGEMALFVPGRTPEEPTRSLFAALLVFLAQQITDAARLAILALAVGTSAPVTAGLGGTIGSGAALAAAWLAPTLPPWLGRLRRLGGIVLVVVGVGLLERALIA